MYLQLWPYMKTRISYVDQQNQLPLMKQDPKTKWLSEADSSALQNGVRDLQDAFDNFYDGLKTGEKGRIPEIQMQAWLCMQLPNDQ